MWIIYGKWSIKAHSVNENDFKYILGRYKTEERAKEVINEINEAYSDFEYYKYTDASEREAKYEKLDTYEMPEK